MFKIIDDWLATSTPDQIKTQEFHLFWTDTDTVCIAALITKDNPEEDDLLMFERGAHIQMIEFYKSKKKTENVDLTMAGRFWKNSKAIAFWSDFPNSSVKYPSSEDLRQYVNRIRNYSSEDGTQGVDISSYTLYKELPMDDTVIAIPVVDYIRGNYTGEENKAEHFQKSGGSSPSAAPSKINRFPGQDEYSKLRSYRAWNGMEIDEGKKRRKMFKITRRDLREMVNEAVKALLRGDS